MELALAFGPPVDCKLEAEDELEPTQVEDTLDDAKPAAPVAAAGGRSKAKRPLLRRASRAKLVGRFLCLNSTWLAPSQSQGTPPECSEG